MQDARYKMHDTRCKIQDAADNTSSDTKWDDNTLVNGLSTACKTAVIQASILGKRMCTHHLCVLILQDPVTRLAWPINPQTLIQTPGPFNQDRTRENANCRSPIPGSFERPPKTIFKYIEPFTFLVEAMIPPVQG